MWRNSWKANRHDHCCCRSWGTLVKINIWKSKLKSNNSGQAWIEASRYTQLQSSTFEAIVFVVTLFVRKTRHSFPKRSQPDWFYPYAGFFLSYTWMSSIAVGHQHPCKVMLQCDTRHSQPPVTSASCWRWQTRLGFLSMPGILFSLSFPGALKGLWASHPESLSIKTHKAAGLFSLF